MLGTLHATDSLEGHWLARAANLGGGGYALELRNDEPWSAGPLDAALMVETVDTLSRDSKAAHEALAAQVAEHIEVSEQRSSAHVQRLRQVEDLLRIGVVALELAEQRPLVGQWCDFIELAAGRGCGRSPIGNGSAAHGVGHFGPHEHSAQGAQINAREYGNTFTPLMYAACMGHVALVTLLLERGADPQKMTKGGGMVPSPPINKITKQFTLGGGALWQLPRPVYILPRS